MRGSVFVRRAVRRLSRWPRPVWARVILWAATLLCLFNVTVAFFGNSVIFPLSPFCLRARAQALTRYLRHRPVCLFVGHPPTEALVTQAERHHHLPAGLLLALLEVESGLNPHRISSSGAMGIAQLVPGTADLLHIEDPYDTEQAVDASARYLSQQLEHFRSVSLALAAYNAGPGSVNGAVPVNGETEKYVQQVTDEYVRIRAHGIR